MSEQKKNTDTLSNGLLPRRDIKFRAWDGKRMIEYGYIEQGCYPEMGYNYLEDYFEDSELQYMQYTGKKDKEENEIYEGDIILYFEGEDNEKKCIVEYHNVSFYIKDKRGAWGEFEPLFLRVIGNIFEHPHLLDKQS